MLIVELVEWNTDKPALTVTSVKRSPAHTSQFLASLRFSLYNEPRYNGPCLTRSAATINAPLHISFPVYNGQSCMPMINIPINIELSGWVGTVHNYFFWLPGHQVIISNFKSTIPKSWLMLQYQSFWKCLPNGKHFVWMKWPAELGPSI